MSPSIDKSHLGAKNARAREQKGTHEHATNRSEEHLA